MRPRRHRRDRPGLRLGMIAARGALRSERATRLRPARRARGPLRRHARLRRAAALRELRRHGRRGRRDPLAAVVEQADRRRQRLRPVRDGAPAGLRRRARDRLGNADRVAALGLDARAGVPGRSRRLRRACRRRGRIAPTRSCSLRRNRLRRPVAPGVRGGSPDRDDRPRPRGSDGRLPAASPCPLSRRRA